MTDPIITSLEQAGEGSRELDCELAVLLDGFVIDGERYGLPRYCRVNETGGLDCPGQNGDDMVPRYTTSLDRALALAERTITRRGPIDLSICGSAQAVIHHHDPCGVPLAAAFGNTAALALCIAVLKATEVRDEH